MDPISLAAKSAAAPQMAQNVISKPQSSTLEAANSAAAATPTLALGASQSAQTARSNLAASPQQTDATGKPQEPERTLLPYGVTMLPDGKPDSPATFAEPTSMLPTDPTPSGNAA